MLIFNLHIFNFSITQYTRKRLAFLVTFYILLRNNSASLQYSTGAVSMLYLTMSDTVDCEPALLVKPKPGLVLTVSSDQ